MDQHGLLNHHYSIKRLWIILKQILLELLSINFNFRMAYQLLKPGMLIGAAMGGSHYLFYSMIWRRESVIIIIILEKSNVSRSYHW